ncbi:MAG: hypothetical protein CMC13_16355 [Flavobacteriaceae bacterium]|nr:hypothetical protein [Flavobacteriaceae bacterium]|tara:strand:- start:3859 stop:4563 length:705 start_codon:yes stop_codon:yes gene_type:complete
MVQKLLLGMVLLFSSALMAQDPDLIETNWFLDRVVISGEEHFPLVNEEVPNVPLFFEDNGNGLLFWSFVCDALGGEPIFFGTDSFAIEELVQTLGGCFNNDNLPFQLTYFEFYFANASMTDPYLYDITDDGNSGKSMTITNVNGDTAYYNNALLSVEETNFDSISLYPNPATDRVTIQAEISVDQVHLYNVLGNRLLSQKNQTNTIDISSLSAGVYFVEVVSSQQRSIQKLIKK